MPSNAPFFVSLHLPKTAGTSLRSALRTRFGASIAEDYGSHPMHAPRVRRECSALMQGFRLRTALEAGIVAVHGHFLPLKYRIALRGKPARYATWLRDPVERVVSHYHFWRRDYRGDDPAQALRNRMLNEGWSLERFCLGPEMRNVYRQYLWGFDPSRFDFIGITERYEADFERFSQRYLDGQTAASTALVNPDRDGERYDLPPDLRVRIARHHAADVALYAWAEARHRA